MATITITFATTNNGTYTRNINVADGDLLRLLLAANTALLRDGTTPTNAELVAKKDAILTKVTDAFFFWLKAMTRDFEVKKAQKEAEKAVTPIAEIP